jgi:glutathione S-transferase
MKLHHSPTSPYVRKVMLALHATGQVDSVTLVNSSGTPLDPNPGAVAANPLGKIPALEREDGPTLYDSRVICRYVDSLHDGPKLYPAGEALFSTLTLEALADGVLDAALLVVYESRLRPEDKRFEPWVEGQRAKIRRALDALEREWIAHLRGPTTMGALAVAATLDYLDLRMPVGDWRDGRPALAAWFEIAKAAPGFAETAPEA